MLPDIYPTNTKIQALTKTSTQMFTAVLLIAAKACKQIKCPSVDGWTNYDEYRPWTIIPWWKVITIKPWKVMEEF